MVAGSSPARAAKTKEGIMPMTWSSSSTSNFFTYENYVYHMDSQSNYISKKDSARKRYKKKYLRVIPDVDPIKRRLP